MSWRRKKRPGADRGDTNGALPLEQVADAAGVVVLAEALERDYALPNPDIEQAQLLEPFFGLYRLFSLRNEHLITLCIAAFRTLARQTHGVMTRDEMEQTLHHLSWPTRNRVLGVLQDYGWIVSNGIRYEIPEKARTMLMAMLQALTRPDRGFAGDIDTTVAMLAVDEVAGADEEASRANVESAVGLLRSIKMQLQRVLEQRSPIEAKKALERSGDIRQSLENINRYMRERNRKRYHYALTTEVQSLTAQIMRLHQDLFLAIQQDIQANARAFGQYLSPEQVEEFLHRASPEQLAGLLRRRFASPRQSVAVTRSELLQRGAAYLQHRPEVQEPTGDPPVGQVQQREVSIRRQEGHAADYYRELVARLCQHPILPLPQTVSAATFGETVYRTGLLVTVRRDVADRPAALQFDIQTDQTFVDLPQGPVLSMTDGTVHLRSMPQDSKEGVDNP